MRIADCGFLIADFLSKITIVEEEIDESAYWLELIEEAGLLPASELNLLKKKNEADELTVIFTASGKTARQSVIKK